MEVLLRSVVTPKKDRFLVVEDRKDDLIGLKKCLTKLGYGSIV
jgi:hypothetical protein